MWTSLAARRRIAAAVAAAAALALAPGAATASGGERVVKVRDACDPVSFNDPAQIPGQPPGGVCNPIEGGGGRVTFSALIDRLIDDGEHGAWSFGAQRLKIDAGESLSVVHDRGGELHSFTEVDEFGPGCVPELNALLFHSPEPGPACTPEAIATTAIGPGGRLDVAGLDRGTHRFMCLVHPWMKTTVAVR
jgi:hypothetical protein